MTSPHEGGVFPRHIESNNDPDVARVAGAGDPHVPVAPRPDGYNPLGVKNLDPKWIRELGQTGKDCFDAIVARDIKALGASMNDCMKCWETLLPHTVRHPTIKVDLVGLLEHYQARYAGAMYQRLRRRLSVCRLRRAGAGGVQGEGRRIRMKRVIVSGGFDDLDSPTSGFSRKPASSAICTWCFGRMKSSACRCSRWRARVCAVGSSPCERHHNRRREGCCGFIADRRHGRCPTFGPLPKIGHAGQTHLAAPRRGLPRDPQFRSGIRARPHRRHR